MGTAEFGVTPFSDLTGTGTPPGPSVVGGEAEPCPGILADEQDRHLAFVSQRGILRTRGLSACPKLQEAGTGTLQACVPAQLRARAAGTWSLRPQHPCLSISQPTTQMAKDMDGWRGRGRIWERRGQYCDLGGPICPPEEEFGQLYGLQRAAGRALNVDRKVGSDERGQTVPPTCDWRKGAGIISPVKDQVPASTQPGSVQPQW